MQQRKLTQARDLVVCILTSRKLLKGEKLRGKT